jgi:formylglycine-generating enzyme required for sulfatase activity
MKNVFLSLVSLLVVISLGARAETPVCSGAASPDKKDKKEKKDKKKSKEKEPTVQQTFDADPVTVNGVVFWMVKVEGGTFTMGATAEQGSVAQSNEKPAHQVTLSDFSIGQTEVTQELWLAVMGTNPSNFTSANGYSDNLKRPVEGVSWEDCQAFIKQLNFLTGMTFRLPTEAEWEFAARGGVKGKGCLYAGSNEIAEVAWFWNTIPSRSSGKEGYGTQPVATKAPNELGIYDMTGNVWEWCNDKYGYYNANAQKNPKGPSSGAYRVYRGGCWDNDAAGCRVAYRYGSKPAGKEDFLGLRLAM